MLLRRLNSSTGLMLPQADPEFALCSWRSYSDSRDPKLEPAKRDHSGCPPRAGGHRMPEQMRMQLDAADC